jgi:hypothetical protein
MMDLGALMGMLPPLPPEEVTPLPVPGTPPRGIQALSVLLGGLGAGISGQPAVLGMVVDQIEKLRQDVETVKRTNVEREERARLAEREIGLRARAGLAQEAVTQTATTARSELIQRYLNERQERSQDYRTWLEGERQAGRISLAEYNGELRRQQAAYESTLPARPRAAGGQRVPSQVDVEAARTKAFSSWQDFDSQLQTDPRLVPQGAAWFSQSMAGLIDDFAEIGAGTKTFPFSIELGGPLEAGEQGPVETKTFESPMDLARWLQKMALVKVESDPSPFGTGKPPTRWRQLVLKALQPTIDFLMVAEKRHRGGS